MSQIEHIGEIRENNSSDAKANQEEFLFDTDKDYLKKTKESLANTRYDINTKLRIGLSVWSIFLITSWIVIVAIVLMGNHKHYHLSDSVLIALLTTTTIQIIGIVLIAMNDLFHGKSEL